MDAQARATIYVMALIGVLTAGVPRNEVLSDYRDGFFGKAYGTTIRELRILHRALFVIDDENYISYVQYLPEVHEHPDYQTALTVLKGLD